MLQKIKNRKSRSEGFTIIEVMIVLAIAGLILLIVFLAVPALQRNSRNTERKNDVSSLASAISEFVDNNNGQLPASTADQSTIMSDWSPGYYDKSKTTTVSWDLTQVAAPDPANTNTIKIVTEANCVGNAASIAGTTGSSATPRSVAIIYDVETGSGTSPQCVSAN